MTDKKKNQSRIKVIEEISRTNLRLIVSKKANNKNVSLQRSIVLLLDR